MEVREATIEDVSDLVRLNAEAQSIHVRIAPDVFHDGDEAELLEFFREQIERNDVYTYVAAEAKTPVAYICVMVVRQQGNAFCKPRERLEIDQICVGEECRKRGVGRALVEKARDLAVRQGVGHLELNVWSENSTAVAAFEALGFETFRLKMRMPAEDR